MKPMPMLGAAALTLLFAACDSSPTLDPNATSSVRLALDTAPD